MRVFSRLIGVFKRQPSPRDTASTVQQGPIHQASNVPNIHLHYYIVTNHWDDIKVIYGLNGPYDAQSHEHAKVVGHLARMVKATGVKTTIYKLDDSLNLVELKNQDPPFRDLGNLSYELMKQSELIAFWVSNPAIGVIYGFDKFIPGDARCIALLVKLADVVGAGVYRDKKLTDDLSVTDGTFKRYDIIGFFDKSEPKDIPKDIANLLAVLGHQDAYYRYVAVWSLGQMRDRREVKRLALERLRQVLQSDADNHVRQEASRVLNTLEPF
ncbi:MAG: HEAT repeat domain-containing protein [Nitrososphaera sp.]